MMTSRRVCLAAGGAVASASLAFTSSRRADSENAKIGHRVTLTSVAENFRTEAWAAKGENWAVTKRTLHGGRQETRCRSSSTQAGTHRYSRGSSARRAWSHARRAKRATEECELSFPWSRARRLREGG